MEKKFRVIRITSAYKYNWEMQALVEVRLVCAEYIIDSGRASFKWRYANTDQSVTTTYKPATETEPEVFTDKLYKTLEDFERGNVMSIDDVFFPPTDEQGLCRLVSRNVKRDAEGAFIWAYVKGAAAKWYFRKQLDDICCDYTSGHAEWYADDDIPESYYDAEDVYKYNDYRFIDAEGKEQVHEGVYQRLRLEPDQEVLADKLQAVLDECKAAGMEVYFNLCSSDLRAVNVRKVERIEYEPDVDKETERSYPFEDRVVRTLSGVYDLDTDDEDWEFVVKK